MQPVLKKILEKFKQLRYFERLMVINTVLFVINHLFTFFLNLPKDYFFRFFELPKNIDTFLYQPWSMFTYMFIHYDFMHLFWNMLMLYFIGRLFVEYSGQKNFLPTYFLGGLTGGFAFWVSYNLLPVFLKEDSSLVGASAAIAAVLIYLCTYIPRTEVHVFFFKIPLGFIGLAFVIIDIVQLPQSNPGGHLAHLGGALMGFTLAYNISRMYGDYRKIDLLQKLRASHAKMKSVYKSENAFSEANNKQTKVITKSEKQRRIDEILDKISQSGYDSLSKDEKDFLFQSGNEE